METSGTPILDSDGVFRGYLGTNTDISERVRSEESKELLAAVVEHATEAIVVTDTDGNINYVNPAFEQISGYKRDEVMGANPRVLKSEKHEDSFYQDLWKTISHGRVWRGNFINKKRDGILFEEEATISPIRNSNGKIVNYVAVKRDVTRQAQLQRQLIQSQKMEAIGTLAGGIAHDFNNIVFAIIGYTELALEDLPEDSQARWDLERVLGAGKRAGEMVKQILTFGRQGDPQRRPLNLGPIVKEGLKFLRASIPSTIEIRQHIEPSLEKVHADLTQIHQVLMNLCTNASHAMRETKGTLSVELSSVELDAEFNAQRLGVDPGKYIKLTVSDTGQGIPPEIMERIFEPYFTTKEAGEGTGLGLSVIHGIVKDHGGAITVYSEPGQGSTFNVLLPVIREGEDAGRPTEFESPPRGHERILMVDDEEILVEMGQTILERLGYEVVTRTSAVEALALFKSDPEQFDLIITDLTMPKMTGAELAAEITAVRPGAPIILCTGFGHRFTQEEAAETGIRATIEKPISKIDVANTVRAVLDREGIKRTGPGTYLLPLEDLPERKAVCHSDEPPIPPLAGIDTDAALKRLGGDRTVLWGLLRKFASKYTNTADEIRSAVESGDLELARRLAHTMKALAGAMGAYRLESAAQDLEAILKHHEASPEQILYDEFSSALDGVIESIVRTMGESEAARTTREGPLNCDSPPVDPQRIRRIVSEMAELLQADDLDAVDRLDELKEALAHTPAAQMLPSLEKMIGRYDFKAAGKILTEISDSLEVTIKGDSDGRA